MSKLRENRGEASRLLVILSILVIVMVVVIYIPSWKAFRYRAEKIACDQAMKSATDGLRIEYLDTYTESDVDDARKTIDKVLVARDEICPAGGNVYLIKGEEGVFEPYCGLHYSDVARRTRLNASYAGDTLVEARKKLLKMANEGDPEPESIEITVNSKPLECVYVTEEVPIKRGTSTTKDYDGIVCFYGTGSNGKINYFVYADEDYCAIWHKDDGWTGTAYENM